MQVVHILKGLGLAGAENHLMILLAGLREQGIDARLLLWVSADKPAEDIVAEARKRGIPIERWVMPGNFAPRFFFNLVRYLRQQQPDIVHTHLVHAETYAIPAARLAGVPVVINSSHNDDPFRHHPIFKIRSRILWRLTHRGIAISDAIRQFLIEVEGAKPEQVRTIYYGLTPSPALKMETGKNTRLIGSVCRLVPQKGIFYALEAVSKLLPDYPNLQYRIVGDGVLRNTLEQQVKNLGISQHVQFLGWRQDVKEHMAQFEIFLAPSLWEGFGLVFLEAMAHGIPIIASRVSAIPEVVEDGKTGFLVPPQNTGALAEAIKKLLDDPDLAQKMGAAGRERLETLFTPQRMIDQTAALYREFKRS